MLYEKKKAGGREELKKDSAAFANGGRKKAPGAARMLSLIRENIHYNIGLLWLGLVIMLFNYPVNLALQLSNLDSSTVVSYSTQSSMGGASQVFTAEKVPGFSENAVRIANRVLDGSYTVIAAIVVAAAILCAWGMFRYLFQKPMTDFYNSQPIRRGTRFFANYLSGILIMLICSAAGLLGAVLVSAGWQIGELYYLHALYANIGWLLLFLLCYNFFVIAILLAGNLGTAVGAALCFLAAGPALEELLDSLMSFYFSTFLELSEHTMKALFRCSPIYLIGEHLELVNTYRVEQREGDLLLLGLALASAVLCFIAFLLFLRRPSEAAGQSAAFQWSKRPARLILSIFIGLYASLLAVGTYSFAWSIFFLLTGTVLTHAVLEIVFHMDVRALFRDRIELGFCAAAALLILCCFHFDWIGYDRWLPDREAVASVGVDAEYAGFLEERGAAARAKKHYEIVEEAEKREAKAALRSASYYDSGIDEPLAERMHLSDQEDIACVIGMAKAAEEESVHGAVLEENVPMQVTYRMKNGSIRRRRYFVPEEAFSERMPVLYQSEEYKEALYPILRLTPEEVGVFGLAFRDDPSAQEAAAQAKAHYPVDTDQFSSDWYYGYENVRFNLDTDKTLEKKLLTALQKDLRAMQFSDYHEWVKNDADGISRLRTELLYYIPQEEILLEQEFGSDMRRYGWRFEDKYPVLDCFTEVKKILQEYGLLPEA